jgi:hypothetical protein
MQDFTIVLNKFDTGRKRLSSGIRDLYSRGLVATKLIVRASPHFTLKACPLHYVRGGASGIGVKGIPSSILERGIS